MFVKLLKHEWRANRGLIGLLCSILAISGVLGGGILRYMTWSAAMGNEGMVATYSIILAAAVLTVIFCCIGAMYLLEYRFYQSRFTDRGYLMMTLPVTTHQQLLSGIVITVAGVVLVGIAAAISVAVALCIFLISFEQSTAAELTRIIADGIGQTVAVLKLGNGIHPAVTVLEFAVSFIADVILFMLALTISAQAHRHPVLKGAAVYIGVDILVSEGCALLEMLMQNPMLATLVSGVIYGAVAVTAYFVMYRIIDKQLNLV